MRKLILIFAAAVATAALAATPAVANPGSPGAPGAWWAQDALPFCQAQVAENPGLKLGACMAYFVTSDTGYLTQFCHYLDDQGILDENGITFDECVTEFHQGN